MAKYAQNRYNIKNPEKYLGNKVPFYRSSWEWRFMKFCDEHSSIVKWGSEVIKIPYRNPFTGKYTVYVPDFFISYVDANNVQHNELIEVKPLNQTSLKEAKRSRRNQAYAVLNEAKWAAAKAYCKQSGIQFRIITENDIFVNGRQ
jgi:hypothetical protein